MAVIEQPPKDFPGLKALIVERATIPHSLKVTAWTDDGEIMGVRHRQLAVEGVQFHPESIMTERGHDLLKNFLKGTPA
jgi:anthranilate synthase component 2